MCIRDRLITLNEYETISIATNNGAKAIGAPEGKNNDNKWKPCVFIPIMFIAIKAIKANPKVTIIWLVTVKLYGIIPNKLQNKIKEKMMSKSLWPLYLGL